jgi:hypothetical protein
VRINFPTSPALWLLLSSLTPAIVPPVRADEPPAAAKENSSRGEQTEKAEKSPNVEKPPPVDEFLVLPLRLHVLKADDLAEVDCALTDADLARILKKVNGIWHNAGIHWGLESIVREPAARQEKFKLARDLDGPRSLGIYPILIPEETRKFDGLHVYYLHKFPVNGVWMGSDFALVQETARLREVEGGIDEPIPRVTAHELGHALGLPHRQDRTNLLASGTTGTLLNAREVETARTRAEKRRGSRTVAVLKQQAADAEAGGDKPLARRLWTWLGEIPGGELEAKDHLARLGPEGETKPGGE